jgi:hypothetical protein
MGHITIMTTISANLHSKSPADVQKYKQLEHISVYINIYNLTLTGFNLKSAHEGWTYQEILCPSKFQSNVPTAL